MRSFSVNRSQALFLRKDFSRSAYENGCEIVVMNHSPQQEMVEDLMTIVHTFSCRLDGMRKYKKQLQDEFVEYKLGQVKDDLL